LPDFINYHYSVTPEEARQAVVDGINFAAYKETGSSLYDSDKNRLIGSEQYTSDRDVLKPSPWAEGDFEGKMATLLRWANALNSSDPAFAEAQGLLKGEDSVIGRVIRRNNTSDLPSLEPQEKELPRWIRVPAGLVLGLFTLLCGYASLSLLLVPNKRAPALAVIVGIVLILGCLWILEKCFRLITGRRNRGGLMSPNTLRALSILWLTLPVVGLFTGYYRTMGAIAIFQAAMYFFGFLGLRALARKREAVDDSGDRAKK
jgi:amino acid transporter